ncbi:MAG: hypothetical protein ABI663_03830 [Chryseolinea sp.]
MQKKIQLTIPKPCHEKWNSFTPTVQGGFCGSCQKEVIDFTNWSEEQLKAYFQKPSSNSCGRFKEEQLKVYHYAEPRASVKGWAPFVFASIVILFSSRPVEAQVSKPKSLIEQLLPSETLGEVIMSKADSVITVSGTVTLSSDSSSLSGVNVMHKGAIIATTDSTGKFSFTLAKADSSKVLIFYTPALRRVRYIIKPGQPQHDINIVMGAALEHVKMGGAISVCVISRPWYSPKRWWLGIKRWF